MICDVGEVSQLKLSAQKTTGKLLSFLRSKKRSFFCWTVQLVKTKVYS